jgi:hypothetical protein
MKSHNIDVLACIAAKPFESASPGRFLVIAVVLHALVHRTHAMRSSSAGNVSEQTQHQSVVLTH